MDVALSSFELVPSAGSLLMHINLKGLPYKLSGKSNPEAMFQAISAQSSHGMFNCEKN
jgi:hypothetical protein